MFADLRVEAIGELHDHIIDAGGLGSRDDLVRLRVPIETGDVFGDRAVKQGHILREVSDMPAKFA